MFKNIWKKIILFILMIFSIFSLNIAYWEKIYDWKYWSVELNYWTSWWGSSSSSWPQIQCKWLPGCWKTWIKSYLVKIVDYFIQIVVVLAVFALIFSWIIYMTSAWDDDKANRAKRWIIWSLIWVFLASSAWWIIFLLNNIKF